MKYSIFGFFLILSGLFILYSCETEENKRYQKELEQYGFKYDDIVFCNCIDSGYVDTVELFLNAGKKLNRKS